MVGKVGRATMEAHDFNKLPGPIHDNLTLTIDAVVAHRHLMAEHPGRYSAETASEGVKLNGASMTMLADRFGPRLRRVPFTMEGFPSRDEVELTHDLWHGLNEQGRTAVLKSVTDMVCRRRDKTSDRLPDQTAYAQRLLHRALQIKARK